jgi:hypothetical protein
VSGGAAQTTTAEEAASEQTQADGPAPASTAPQTVALAAEQAKPSDDGGLSSYLIGAGAFLILALGAGFVWWRDG